MTATNHALTGAIIGLVIHNPWVALPAALCSHVICGVIPHFGPDTKNWLKQSSFIRYLVADASLCILLVLLLALFQPAYWHLSVVCAFVATTPDLLWIRELLYTRRKIAYKPNRFEYFLGWIQWFERPIGAVVEVAWLFSASVLLLQFL